MTLPHERGDRAYIEVRRYNVAVPSPHQPDQPSSERPARQRIYTLEAAGVLIIGAVVLLLILVRYWHHIAWGVR